MADDPDRQDSTATISESALGVGDQPSDDDTLSDLKLPHRFHPKRVIGRGGMGVVIEVLDRNLGREVAVKVLAHDKRDPVHQVRFRREAKAAAALRHANIVTVYDVDAERDFIVMELVRGESLRTRIQRERALPPAEVRRIGRSLLGALAAAHDARIIHRDVKPANILIDESETVKLVDFGLVSFGDRDLTSSGARLGTPAYMAPEQLRGRATDARADLYAVGATLFEAATGTQLHGAERSTRDVHGDVLAATGDVALASAIERAVAEQPEDRFQDARAFAAALVPAMPVRTRRMRALVIAAAVLVAGGAVVAVVATRDRDDVLAGSAPTGSQTLRVIAVLPFVDHTRDLSLGGGSSVPHILSEELATIPELAVVGSAQIEASLAELPAPESAWLDAARSANAALIVRGELFPIPSGIRMVVELETITGGKLARFDRETTRERAFAITREIASEIARAAFGRPTVTGEQLPFELELELRRGIEALDRQQFTTADEHLQKVELGAPDLAEAKYYRALLNWWTERDVLAPAKRALEGKLDPVRRGVMESLIMMFVKPDFTRAIEHLRALAARFPDHRDTQYALFEALYHGGYPVEALGVYRRLGDQNPRFRLGLKHALTYYIGHGNEDGMRWASARLDDKFEDRILWKARVLVARRDYTGAVTLLRSHETADPSATQAARRELLGIYLLDGKLDLAVDLVITWSKRDLLHTAPALFALALVRGDRDQLTKWREKATNAAGLATGIDELERGWLELAAMSLAQPDRAHLGQIAKNLDPEGTINVRLAHVLVAGALGDKDVVERSRTSVFPEVAAVADAYQAEWTKDYARAAKRWRQAAEQAADGMFVIDEEVGAARAARAAGDHAAVLAACETVIRPWRFSWAWAGAVGPCLRWSAEAAIQLGRAADARRFWEHLLRLRTEASPDDELVRVAREGLVRQSDR